MLDYIKGAIFIPLFIYFLFLFGKSIKKSGNFSENLIYGFVFYTCLQFIGGFVSQCINLPWMIYKLYMITVIVGIVGFIVWKKNAYFSSIDIKIHFKKYWLIYAIAFVFVCLSCLNLQYQWNANLVDDGYYLHKIRMAPFVENYADYNYAVGFPAPGSIIRNVNTFEIEAAFYVDILGMDASVYAKVFLSFLNYTLILHTIYWFYCTLLKSERVKMLMIAIIPILFFGIYQELMVNFNVLYLQDSWHFNTAVWYGSALVRCMGLFLLITPFIEDFKLTKRKAIFFLCSSIALFSKASQALPLVYIVFFVYLFLFSLNRIKNKKKLFACYIIILGIMIVLPVSDDIAIRNFVVIQQLGQNSNILIIKISYFLIAVSYLLDIRKIRKWNNWLVLAGCIIFIPRINTLFLYVSVYDFVAARTVTLFFFSLIVTAFVYAYMLLTKVITNRKEMVVLYGLVAIVLTSIPLISINRNLGLINTVSTVINNNKLQPGSTLALGDALENISETKGKVLDVLMPMWVVINGTPHPVASMVRYNAMNIHSIGTVPRYGSLYEDNPYYTYTEGVHVNFERWHSGEDGDKQILQNLLDTYSNIDCIVVYFDSAKDRLEDEFGYKIKEKILLEDNVHYYYVMMKE